MEEDHVDSLLDLSHLTEAEQSSILQVLQRDLELRLRDEGRVRELKQTETDPTRLHLLSGSWFSSERSKRHQSRRSAFELVNATIRRRKTKSRGRPGCDAAQCFPVARENPTDGPVVVATATEAPLNELFNQRQEETSTDSASPQAMERLKGESIVCQRSQQLSTGLSTKSNAPQGHQGRSSSLSSKESGKRSNGFSEGPEEDLPDIQNGESDSLSSSMTDPDPISLKTSSSTSSLPSAYMISGSMMSMFNSGDFGVVEVRGRIQYSLVYDIQKEELQVKVLRCEDIASARKNLSDPYVKTYLLPDKSNQSKKKTSVKKKTLNPVYDQTLRYKVRTAELRSRTLNLSVWHAQPLGRNVFLGEVEVSLDHWDWKRTQPLWQDLQPRIYMSPDSVSSRGNIVLSVKFIPDGFEGGGLPLTGELHIWLREAQSLLSSKGGAIDTFVRSYILPDASRQSGQKTRVMKRSLSPTYNHTMVYDGLHTSDLKEACAELTVWQRDGLKSHILGGVRLSCGTGQSYGEAVSWMDSTEEEITVWNSVIDNPNYWIDTTLPIRTNLTYRCL